MDIKTLSARLGLSPGTVSRALNGYTDISERTRQRVMEAARELGYQPNLAARRLKRGKADTIGIVYPLDAGDLGDPRFLEVVTGLTERLQASSLDLLVVPAARGAEMQTYQRMVLGRRVDGVIVARTLTQDPRVDYLLEAGMPFVCYGRTRECERFAWFDFDNAAGVRLAVERLVGLGHRDIAYLHASLELNFARQRHEGYLAAMQQADLTVHAAYVIDAGLGRQAGYQATRALLRQPNPPTAIIVDNNLSGVGVVRALLDEGIRIGSALSLIVYDGVPEDTLHGQRVTSIEQPTPHAAGLQLAELILGVLENRPLDTLQVLWQPSLEPGMSDGPPARR